jgi:hypothetical protein
MNIRSNLIEQQHEARRVQRRVWFALHVVVYALVNLLYMPDPLVMIVKSLLLSTVFIHFYWLYIIGVYESTMRAVAQRAYAVIEEITQDTVPHLGDGQRRLVNDPQQADDFWYRWHNL